MSVEILREQIGKNATMAELLPRIGALSSAERDRLALSFQVPQVSNSAPKEAEYRTAVGEGMQAWAEWYQAGGIREFMDDVQARFGDSTEYVLRQWDRMSRDIQGQGFFASSAGQGMAALGFLKSAEFLSRGGTSGQWSRSAGQTLNPLRWGTGRWFLNAGFGVIGLQAAGVPVMQGAAAAVRGVAGTVLPPVSNAFWAGNYHIFDTIDEGMVGDFGDIDWVRNLTSDTETLTGADFSWNNVREALRNGEDVEAFERQVRHFPPGLQPIAQKIIAIERTGQAPSFTPAEIETAATEVYRLSELAMTRDEMVGFMAPALGQTATEEQLAAYQALYQQSMTGGDYDAWFRLFITNGIDLTAGYMMYSNQYREAFVAAYNRAAEADEARAPSDRMQIDPATIDPTELSGIISQQVGDPQGFINAHRESINQMRLQGLSGWARYKNTFFDHGFVGVGLKAVIAIAVLRGAYQLGDAAISTVSTAAAPKPRVNAEDRTFAPGSRPIRQIASESERLRARIGKPRAKNAAMALYGLLESHQILDVWHHESRDEIIAQFQEGAFATAFDDYMQQISADSATAAVGRRELRAKVMEFLSLTPLDPDAKDRLEQQQRVFGDARSMLYAWSDLEPSNVVAQSISVTAQKAGSGTPETFEFSIGNIRRLRNTGARMYPRVGRGRKDNMYRENTWRNLLTVDGVTMTQSASFAGNPQGKLKIFYEDGKLQISFGDTMKASENWVVTGMKNESRTDRSTDV